MSNDKMGADEMSTGQMSTGDPASRLADAPAAAPGGVATDRDAAGGRDAATGGAATTAGDEDTTNAYQALAETLDGEEHRWAFGGGFSGEAGEHAAEITAAVPDGVDAGDLAAYCLMLGDDALIAAHRLASWATYAPELEEEVALANIALDLLGQARLLLSRAGHLGAAEPYRPGGAGHADEDVLAYFRDERAFRNVALAETDPGDFARTSAWLLVLSSWRLALMQRLTSSPDPALAAVASKAVPELTYHRDYAAQWVLRLGDGTAVSHERMQAGLEAVWPFVEELFTAGEVERRLARVAADPAELRAEVDAVFEQVLTQATLSRPQRRARGLIGGRGARDGVHTEELGPLLAVMQSLARAHPEATW